MSGKRNVRTLLASRGFRRLLAARLTSQFSDGLFSGALAGSILFNPDRQANPVAIATGFAVLLLPYSVLGPFVGVFLDRWPRRNVLVYANLVRTLLALPAAALLATRHDGVAFILLALLVIGINRFILAGHSAALPHVVDGQRLITANALAPTLGTVCTSLALGVSALVQFAVLTGPHAYGALACAAGVGFLIAGLLARAYFRVPELGPDASTRRGGSVPAELVIVARGMVAGARHLLARPNAATVLAAQSAYRVLYGVLTVAALLLYRNYFAAGAHFTHSIVGLAQVVVAGGAGSFVGAMVTPPGVRRFGGRAWVTLLLTAAGVLVVLLGAPFAQPLLVLAVFAINIASQGTKIVVDTTLQRECTDEFRGRVFSVNDTTYNVCYVLGLFVAALVLPADGHSLVMVFVIGLGYAAVGLGYRVLSGALAHRDPATTGTPSVHSGES
ncbi:MFS transporter [Actinocatenispora rupis]|uniref:MFS transporter n=1 Tax=Actinocatenispora rupis TaxID=519421 RepID=A0A8J3JAR4_9ACTN|nr:MFS transporter [Actinocatenispora rupis]GID13269.1 MFS transporter [Actinocatenispora rupis]